ncbi:cytochrome b [Rhodoferax sp.]|uniref:cytochrome b n=1 Tax=Rhodoferax sp. TaxID=50421 RepID=UPI002844F6DF|nr:cytochrome b [Rhodoferax sp.]MDR3368454.1 cytochrome b [Rhodoferax sp.]
MTPSPSYDLSSQPRYTTVAIVLHWLLAMALLVIFALGLYMVELSFSPLRLKLYNWHKWAGVSILLLSVARVVWRVTHRPPALPTTVTRSMPGWQMQAHHATHHLMYALFFAVPLLGWAYSSAAGFPIVLFGQIPLPDFVGADKALAAMIKPLHQLSAWALMGLAALHVAAALKHQWLDRDGLLLRMLPR